MDRRSAIGMLATGALGAAAISRADAQARSKAARKPVVLYCDLSVDPKREAEMLRAFHTRFYPAAAGWRGRGFIDLKLLKIRQVMQGGPAPAKGVNYRFQLTYESEEQRQVWIASPIHQRVWPLLEQTLLNKDYLVLLTDSV